MAKMPDRYCSVDTETNGLDPWLGHRMFAASVAFPDGRRLFFRDNDPLARPWQEFEDILLDPGLDKVYQNAIFDLRMQEFSGFLTKGMIWDTMIFGHLLDGRDAEGGLSLDMLSQKYLPAQYRKIVSEINEWFSTHGGKKEKIDFSHLHPDLLYKRAIGDVDLTLRLFEKFYPTVSRVFPFLLEQEHKLLHVTKKMEDRGLTIDRPLITQQQDEFTEILEKANQFCEDILGTTSFNINSRNDQVTLLKRAGIFSQLTERTKKSKTYPQGQIKLNELALRPIGHPVTDMLLIGKAAKKMRDTFLHQALVYDRDGVNHPRMNQVGTVTGRYSCSKPNLQNIPIESDHHGWITEEEAEQQYEMTGIRFGQHLKRIYLVRPGYIHMHSDKSQAELRALAHYSKDKKLTDLFLHGSGDIHTDICYECFGEMNPGLRRREKAVVFGYQYGASTVTIATKMMKRGSVADAKNIINRLQQTFPGLPRWKSKLNNELADNGFVVTAHGRRHYLRAKEAYMLVNRMCQGTVGDEVKNRMVAINDLLVSQGVDATIILNIHDDIATEMRQEDAPELIPMIAKVMDEQSQPFMPPMIGDCSLTMTRWADKKKCDITQVAKFISEHKEAADDVHA